MSIIVVKKEQNYVKLMKFEDLNEENPRKLKIPLTLKSQMFKRALIFFCLINLSFLFYRNCIRQIGSAWETTNNELILDISAHADGGPRSRVCTR